MLTSTEVTNDHTGRLSRGNKGSGGSPDDGGCDLGTNEDTQNADGVGGKHADDGEGEGQVLV